VADDFDLTELIGAAVAKSNKLDEKQKKWVCLQAYSLWLNDEKINWKKIWDQWPKVPDYFDIENETYDYYKSGKRPLQGDIEGFFITEEFRKRMHDFGVELDLEVGLTEKQLGMLHILSNVADNRPFSRQLKEAGVRTSEWKAWLKQPVFANAYNKMLGEALKEAMPLAKAKLANKIGQGDIQAIKFGMEVTGTYNPAQQKQVDAEQLLNVVLEVLEEKVKDRELLAAIAQGIALKRQFMMGVPFNNPVDLNSNTTIQGELA